MPSPKAAPTRDRVLAACVTPAELTAALRKKRPGKVSRLSPRPVRSGCGHSEGRPAQGSQGRRQPDTAQSWRLVEGQQWSTSPSVDSTVAAPLQATYPSSSTESPSMSSSENVSRSPTLSSSSLSLSSFSSTTKLPPVPLTLGVARGDAMSIQTKASSLPDLLSQADHLTTADQNLLSNWCTSTYKSMSQDSLGQRIWQRVVPQQGLQHPFLLQGILALSALELSSAAEPQKAYLLAAETHKAEALRGLPDAADLSSANSSAVFALSVILIIFSFASSRPAASDSASSPLQALCRVFQTTRESAVVLFEALNLVQAQDGDLSPLLRKADSSPPGMPNTSTLAILTLKQANIRLASSSPRDASADMPVYTKTIEQLGICLGKLYDGGEPSLAGFIWILNIPARFLDLLAAREPLAVAIVGQYCVLMHQIRGRWWIGDWGVRLLREVYQLLDHKDRLYIRWALDATGCFD